MKRQNQIEQQLESEMGTGFIQEFIKIISNSMFLVFFKVPVKEGTLGIRFLNRRSRTPREPSLWPFWTAGILNKHLGVSGTPSSRHTPSALYPS